MLQGGSLTSILFSREMSLLIAQAAQFFFDIFFKRSFSIKSVVVKDFVKEMPEVGGFFSVIPVNRN